jgi:hypothetical protein
MAEYDSESLPFDHPEQENVRLREENARLRRLLAAHGLPIPRLTPENRIPAKSVEPLSPVDKEERAKKGLLCFGACFEEGKTFTPGGGKTRMADTATLQRT